MKSGSRKSTWIFAILGIFPVIWFALLTAPYLSGGLIGIVKGLPEAMDHPFSMELCKDSAKLSFFFTGVWTGDRDLPVHPAKVPQGRRTWFRCVGRRPGDQPEIQ